MTVPPPRADRPRSSSASTCSSRLTRSILRLTFLASRPPPASATLPESSTSPRTRLHRRRHRFPRLLPDSPRLLRLLRCPRSPRLLRLLDRLPSATAMSPCLPPFIRLANRAQLQEPRDWLHSLWRRLVPHRGPLNLRVPPEELWLRHHPSLCQPVRLPPSLDGLVLTLRSGYSMITNTCS